MRAAPSCCPERQCHSVVISQPRLAGEVQDPYVVVERYLATDALLHRTKPSSTGRERGICHAVSGGDCYRFSHAGVIRLPALPATEQDRRIPSVCVQMLRDTAYAR